MKFKTNEENAEFLKVEHITNRDSFTIMNEAKPYKGQFTKGEEAVCEVKRKSDGKVFTFVLKTFNINNLVSVFGESSEDWVNKDIEIARKYSDKYRKNFLAVTPIIPEVNMEAPF